MFGALNKSNAIVREGVDTRANDFAKLDAFCGNELPVDGFFFTQSKYGKQVVVVSGKYNINMPARAVEQFEAIAADPVLKQGVIDGKLKLIGIKLLPEYKTTGYELADA